MDQATLEDLKGQINLVLDAEAVLYQINYKVESMEQRGISIRAFCPIRPPTAVYSSSRSAPVTASVEPSLKLDHREATMVWT